MKGWLLNMSEATNNIVEETVEVDFDTLMSDITNILDEIQTGTTNNFIIKECGIIDVKLDEIRVRKYNNIDTIESICHSINKDISKMRGVLNQSEEMYIKYDALESMVQQIPSVYQPL